MSFPDQLAQVGPKAFLVRCCDGFGHGLPRHDSRLDNLNHAEASRAPFYLGAILLSSTSRRSASYRRLRTTSKRVVRSPKKMAMRSDASPYDGYHGSVPKVGVGLGSRGRPQAVRGTENRLECRHSSACYAAFPPGIGLSATASAMILAACSAAVPS